jgi:hypothetical protein
MQTSSSVDARRQRRAGWSRAVDVSGARAVVTKTRATASPRMHAATAADFFRSEVDAVVAQVVARRR